MKRPVRDMSSILNNIVLLNSYDSIDMVQEKNHRKYYC